MLADGQILGPLSMRNNLGYGPNNAFRYPDTPANDQDYRLKYEQMLGLNLGDYTTICGYSVPTAETIPELAQVLANPADIIYPAVGGK